MWFAIALLSLVQLFFVVIAVRLRSFRHLLFSLSDEIVGVPMPSPRSAIKKRDWALDLGTVTIEPGQTAKISACPQVLFRAQRLIATGDIEGVFMEYLFVGNQNQLPVLANPISLKCFAAGLMGNEMQLDTCQPALAITAVLVNKSDVARVFSLTAFGVAAGGEPVPRVSSELQKQVVAD